MAAIISWYNNTYSSWNRTRRMRAPTFVARTETQTSRVAVASRNTTNSTTNTTANPGDVVINMAEPAPTTPLTGDKKDNKDTLFGPNIGIVGAGPEWASDPSEKKLAKKDGEKVDEDELTPDIVKEWMKRSSDPAQPTTTLQALVNLKRPTIRLSPLAHPVPETAGSSSSVAQPHLQQQHGLEFEFDCDAPRCAISLHIVGVPSHLAVGEDHDGDFSRSREALAIAGSNDADSDRLHLFEAVVDGGFGRKLPLGAGAALELAKLESAAQAHKKALDATAGTLPLNSTEKINATGTDPKERSDSHEHTRKRMTFFRKRSHHQSSMLNANSANSHNGTAPATSTATAGPALAVVDAEGTTHREPVTEESTGANAGAAGKSTAEEDEGVRVAICLSARDADGRPLRVRNEQVTYLHVVRHGPPHNSTASAPTEGAAASDNTNAATTTDRERSEEEDRRPWVVKVVKREARIGAHAFHLHEIYGLTAHAALPTSPSEPLPADASAHTYPPTSGGAITAAPSGGEDEAASECLLCLSAPREVVLLPCRHLVACAECAANMVEFGAGGTVTAPAEPAPAAEPTGPANGEGGAASNGDGQAGNGDGETAAAPAPPPPVTVRRKRKAKGWFCPVCRQPYTALLRITTHPPENSKVSDPASLPIAVEGKRLSGMSSSEEEGEPDHEPETQQQPQMASRTGDDVTTTTAPPPAHPLTIDTSNPVYIMA